MSLKRKSPYTAKIPKKQKKNEYGRELFKKKFYDIEKKNSSILIICVSICCIYK